MTIPLIVKNQVFIYVFCILTSSSSLSGVTVYLILMQPKSTDLQRQEYFPRVFLNSVSFNVQKFYGSLTFYVVFVSFSSYVFAFTFHWVIFNVFVISSMLFCFSTIKLWADCSFQRGVHAHLLLCGHFDWLQLQNLLHVHLDLPADHFTIFFSCILSYCCCSTPCLLIAITTIWAG